LFCTGRSFEVVVGFAIAVVVLAVADLRFGKTLTSTDPPLSSVTGLRTTFADAFVFASSRSGKTGACHGFVDRAVTIIILVVAELGAGDDLTSTGSPLAAGAGLCTAFADAFARSSRTSGVTSAGLAVETIATFVYKTVAIVVLAVAEFFGADDLSLTGRKLSGGAGTFAGFAKTFAEIATFAIGKTAFVSAGVAGFVVTVDVTVTIVVFVVADLTRRFRRSFAGAPGSFGTDLLAGGAGTCTSIIAATIAFTACGGVVTFALDSIDLAITIVVDTITTFTGGKDLSETDGPFAIAAGLSAGATDAFACLAGVTVKAGAGIAVDRSVAIVVLAITHFFARLDFADTG
jgi:hypothetical protein